MQLEAISSSYLEKEIKPCLTTSSCQAVVESNKVSPELPFFQAKQPQFPQPLLRILPHQTLHQFCCPSLDMIQHLHVFLVARGPKLNTGFEVSPVSSTERQSLPQSCWPHYFCSKPGCHWSWPCGHTAWSCSVCQRQSGIPNKYLLPYAQ